MAQAVNPCLAVTANRRLAVLRPLATLGTEPLLFRGNQDVHDHEDRQRSHQPDRERRAEWLILRRVELIADYVPNEFIRAATKDVGDDVLAGHRDEDQQSSGDDAG